MVDTRMRTESAKSYSNKYQDVKGMPSYGGYNPIVEPEKDMLVKRLMEKITSLVTTYQTHSCACHFPRNHPINLSFCIKL